MKYLKRINESREPFPNSKEVIDIIDYYIKNSSHLINLEVEKIPGLGPDWSRAIKDVHNVKYYFRIFPDDFGYVPEHIKIPPRIECHLTTSIENCEELQEFYEELSFLPKILLDSGFYAKMYFNSGDNGDTNCWIGITVYTSQEDLDSAKSKSIYPNK